MRRLRRPAALLLLLPLLSLLPAGVVVNAQEGVGIPLGDPHAPLVQRMDLYCAGFISKNKVPDRFLIVGGEMEDERIAYHSGDIVYLNYGARDGATPGESLYVVRPRGEYESPFTGKDLGYYVEEKGMVRIVSVQRRVSTARVVAVCDDIQLGDVLRPFDQYLAPTPRDYVPLNRYDLPTGKLSGQIVLSKHQRNYLTERDIVYVDIGDKDGVKMGQYYTVYREPGHEEGPVGPERWWNDDNIMWNRLDGFKDDRHKNGGFSNQAPYKYDDEVREKRPDMPRKVVGELLIIRVEGKAATAVITRVTQEINVGDYVELQ